jgi:putative membrane protein
MAEPEQPGHNQPNQDPGIYMAAERTYLAWIRTGLALMGFGFVVARFGLFLRELAAVGGARPLAPGFSSHIGTTLVILGVALTVAAIFRYRALLRRIERGGEMHRPSKLALLLGGALAAVGCVISTYLLFAA